MPHSDDDSSKQYLKAILALQLRALGPDARVEGLLDDLGFNARDAASLLGKSEAAVSKAMQRARKAK